MSDVEVKSVIEQSGLDSVRELIREYADELENDDWICRKTLEEQLKSLPGDFAPPPGSILLAKRRNYEVGCVLMKPYDESSAEMHRLYVRPDCRGEGIGRQLARNLIERTRSKGYDSLRLVTTQNMTEAQSLYRSLGFEETEPFHRYGDEFIYMIKKLLSNQYGTDK
ncbi:MAG: GNAT family N-acetyltransferase [bacterium]